MSATPISGCRLCGGRDLRAVIDLGEQPLANALPRSAEEPVDRFPLALVCCADCGLAQLTVSVDPAVLFTDYAYLSGYSPSVGRAAGEHVAQLMRERQLGSDDLVVEVASNDGYLLRHYVDAGVPVLGIDPAHNVAPVAEAAGVPTLTAFFDDAVARRLRDDGRRASIIHANNVIAHVPDIVPFVRGFATLLRDDGVAVIETPYLGDLVDGLAYDTIYHEHVFAYSLTSLARLLEAAELVVVDVERIAIHGGSLRISAMRAGSAVAPAPAVEDLLTAEHARGIDVPEGLVAFGAQVDALRAQQAEFLVEAADRGPLAGHGAAAKATVTLNALGGAGGLLERVADASPLKQGRVIPGVGVPIVAPEALRAQPPKTLVILAWNFAPEIAASYADLAARGTQLAVLVPHVRGL